jgi:hypothetical protein
MRKIMIYPAHDRMVANPAYRVRLPHDPTKILPVQGQLVPAVTAVYRAIRRGDVETDEQRAERAAEAEAKKTKAKKATAKKG